MGTAILNNPVSQQELDGYLSKPSPKTKRPIPTATARARREAALAKEASISPALPPSPKHGLLEQEAYPSPPVSPAVHAPFDEPEAQIPDSQPDFPADVDGFGDVPVEVPALQFSGETEDASSLPRTAEAAASPTPEIFIKPASIGGPEELGTTIVDNTQNTEVESIEDRPIEISSHRSNADDRHLAAAIARRKVDKGKGRMVDSPTGSVVGQVTQVMRSKGHKTKVRPANTTAQARKLTRTSATTGALQASKCHHLDREGGRRRAQF